MNTLYKRAAELPAHTGVHITTPPAPTPSDAVDLPNQSPSSLRRLVGLLSKDEVSGLLQVSAATLALWRSKKKGPPYVRLGTRVFYLVDELEEWVGNQFEQQQGEPKQDHHGKRKPKDQEKIPLAAVFAVQPTT